MTRRCKAKPSEDGNYLPNGQAAKSGLNRSLLSRVLSRIEAFVEYHFLKKFPAISR
jgi:putative transposase